MKKINFYFFKPFACGGSIFARSKVYFSPFFFDINARLVVREMPVKQDRAHKQKHVRVTRFTVSIFISCRSLQGTRIARLQPFQCLIRAGTLYQII